MASTAASPLWPQVRPDFGRLLTVLRHKGLPDRVPFFEIFADAEFVAAALGERQALPQPGDRAAREAALQQRIRFCQRVGYDFVWVGTSPALPISHLQTDDTAAYSREQRGWVNESAGIIGSLADLESYPWPRQEDIDYTDIDYLAQHVPEGMKLIAFTSGVLEYVMWLMGYAPFAVALYENPDLVQALFEGVGSLLLAIHETHCDYASVGASCLGDDIGHRSGTMIHPDHLRQYVLPRQRQLAQVAHAHGLPFILHSCGNLREVMSDLIDGVGIDAKHSFEDTFLPVAEAKRLYGDRIAILGGVDMDFLSRSSEDQVRAYTRRVLDACMPGGGYALGSGNSVANYVPVRNYLAMLDEGIRMGSYR